MQENNAEKKAEAVRRVEALERAIEKSSAKKDEPNGETGLFSKA